MRINITPYVPPPNVARKPQDICEDIARNDWVGRGSTMELPTDAPPNGEQRDKEPMFP